MYMSTKSPKTGEEKGSIIVYFGILLFKNRGKKKRILIGQTLKPNPYISNNLNQEPSIKHYHIMICTNINIHL